MRTKSGDHYKKLSARSGDIDEARFLFEKMLGYAKHLGLYPEELVPDEKGRKTTASLRPQ
jgi:hypothetical protein